MRITLVTGNIGKLAEWQRMLPDNIDLASEPLDLDEIQSLDLQKIAIDKAERAFTMLQQPVIIEDVAFGLEKLNGLPGPFMRYFNEALGRNAMYILAGSTSGEPATATCTAVYYDGDKTLVGVGTIHGVIVAPRGDSSFGFDPVFQPEGQTQTFAEMTGEQKDAISHRSKAIKDLVRQIDEQL